MTVHEPATEWRPTSLFIDEAALGVRIDVSRTPVVIELEGTLDEHTGSSLVFVVRELMADGSREFELQTSALRVPDSGGRRVLDELRKAIHAGGGRLAWDESMASSTVDCPIP